jgi:hypothetical protein
MAATGGLLASAAPTSAEAREGTRGQRGHLPGAGHNAGRPEAGEGALVPGGGTWYMTPYPRSRATADTLVGEKTQGEESARRT